MDDSKGLTYKDSGVDYDAMDPFKRMAQLAARETDRCAHQFGFQVVEWSRGESVFLIETPWGYLAQVEEGLGTKNLVADAMLELAGTMSNHLGESLYDRVAQCNVAMAVNDMITLGALPVSYAQHLAVGNSAWFNNDRRCRDLVEGTKRACLQAGCVWGGGETPTLKDVVYPLASVLSGSAMGVIMSKDRIINPARIQHGDVIVMFTSSGLHANGYTLAREIAKKLSNGYFTEVYDTGRTFGEVLLDPTHIYVDVIRICQMGGVDIHYAVNMTGHAWRKLMRANGNFAYIIDQLPPYASPIFPFLREHGPVTTVEAYGNLNMGAGFAIYVPPECVDAVLNLTEDSPYDAYVAGYIEASDQKRVVISPLGIEFGAESLAVR